MRHIVYKVIPHNRQRYDTTGDFFTHKGIEHFRVSRMANERMEHLVLIHELVERVLCYHRGISNQDIDRFDLWFESVRAEDSKTEPGDDPRAPYRREHRFATKIERLLAKELGVSWREYGKAIARLA